MKRRQFIKTCIGGSCILLLPTSLAAVNRNKTKPLTFGISTDIHQDIMHDAEVRLQHFINESEKQNLDFIIDLGDFCFPKKENLNFVKIWKSSSMERFNVLGNHDMDIGTKTDFMEFVGMTDRYYSFDKDEIHFVVLDPNNLLIDGNYIPYNNGNFYKPSEQRAHVDPEQLEWLKKDLADTDKHCIIFSHQSFDSLKASKKRDQVRNIFEDANQKAGFQKVIAAFNGHSHIDSAREVNGIQYIQINSMSNKWVGEKYKCPERFPDSVNRRRPTIQFTTPYKDPLYAIVTIKKNVLKIQGVESTYIKPGPSELGIPTNEEFGNLLVPRISDRKFDFE